MPSGVPRSLRTRSSGRRAGRRLAAVSGLPSDVRGPVRPTVRSHRLVLRLGPSVLPGDVHRRVAGMRIVVDVRPVVERGISLIEFGNARVVAGGVLLPDGLHRMPGPRLDEGPELRVAHQDAVVDAAGMIA